MDLMEVSEETVFNKVMGSETRLNLLVKCLLDRNGWQGVSWRSSVGKEKSGIKFENKGQLGKVIKYVHFLGNGSTGKNILNAEGIDFNKQTAEIQ